MPDDAAPDAAPDNAPDDDQAAPTSEGPRAPQPPEPPQPRPPALPWLEWTPGERVVVRYRAEDGAHEALGELLETRPDGVRIATLRGEVDIHASTMVIGKRVPTTPPPRRPRRS